MHSVITEAQCVTNEKFNETLSMDQRPGPRPQTDYEISHFLLQHGALFIIAQCGYLRNPLLSWAPQPGDRAETTQLREKVQRNNTGRKQKIGIHFTLISLFLFSCAASIYLNKDKSEKSFMDHLNESWGVTRLIFWICNLLQTVLPTVLLSLDFIKVKFPCWWKLFQSVQKSIKAYSHL